ncbi:hypothetical protein [Pelosinus propionicus]|uniref:Uncharacterized protein n=1 Tax=Pelosinus propionicus DSM 13327 TaxID=1123291 RepID=A0A1I4N312_9FIRM|nr:hypothetical protein [Pelosinus propionicus]SFM09643.1 hypothetical protein SAMN04490355_104055 [Pelosinus propionicus DSM 13327]
MSDYTVKKSVCERYDLRFGDFGWATFTIDENGGLFNCQSDYGDYSYSWPRHGRKTFKHFLIEITRDYHYLLNKISDTTYFNFDKTISEWKKLIIEWRKDNGINKKQAREAFDDIVNIDDGSADYVYMQLTESDMIREICPDAWEVFDCVKEFPAAAMAFATEVMPMFSEILKQEIEVERAG